MLLCSFDLMSPFKPKSLFAPDLTSFMLSMTIPALELPGSPLKLLWWTTSTRSDAPVSPKLLLVPVVWSGHCVVDEEEEDVDEEGDEVDVAVDKLLLLYMLPALFLTHSSFKSIKEPVAEDDDEDEESDCSFDFMRARACC